MLQSVSDNDSNPTFQGNILLVEDNHVNQLLMERYLLKLGFKVIIANNGQDAIEKVQLHDFQLILMDLEMPILGGIAAAKQIRERGLSAVPILALTAHTDLGTRRLCKQAKMNGYLIKPITFKNLVIELKRYFN